MGLFKKHETIKEVKNKTIKKVKNKSQYTLETVLKEMTLLEKSKLFNELQKASKLKSEIEQLIDNVISLIPCFEIQETKKIYTFNTCTIYISRDGKIEKEYHWYEDLYSYPLEKKIEIINLDKNDESNYTRDKVKLLKDIEYKLKKLNNRGSKLKKIND